MHYPGIWSAAGQQKAAHHGHCLLRVQLPDGEGSITVKAEKKVTEHEQLDNGSRVCVPGCDLVHTLAHDDRLASGGKREITLAGER